MNPNKSLYRILLVISILYIGIFLKAQVSGLVYRDYNGNGQRDSSLNALEPGVSNFLVRIFNQSGIIDSVLTNDAGYFYFTNTSSEPLRIEFIETDPFDFPGPMLKSNTGSGSNVQMVSKFPAFLYFGVFYPGDFCQDPDLVMPCYVSGDPLENLSATKDYDDFVKIKFSYGGNGFSSIVPFSQGGGAPNMEIIAKAKELGSCWGVAYQRLTNTIFTSATLKRHVGLGPLGIGGLYTIDLTTNTPMPFIDLNTIGVPSGSFLNNKQRNLPDFFPPLSSDSLAYSAIGKVGYGGIDFNEDHTELYIISLYTKKLYKIHLGNPYTIPTANDVDSFSIPDPVCNKGNFRPWALKYYKGKFYIGVTCDGSIPGATFSDLDATVYSFDPLTKIFTQVLAFDFNYPYNNIRPAFFPWLDSWDANCEGLPNIYCTYPQAILSDIEFDGSAHMVLGIMDRYGFQGGINQYNLEGEGRYSVLASGDVLRAKKIINSDLFEIESNAKSGNIQTAGANTGYGPGGGEYYYGDFSANRQGIIIEFETSNGALAVCPGKNQTVTTASDPIDFNSSGLIFLNNSSGNWDKRYQIVDPNFAGYLGKSTSLGDLKLINQSAYFEVGNNIWNDLNNNGVQDPHEPPIGNVEVQLWRENLLIATAVTNKEGKYLFSNAPLPANQPADPAFVYNLQSLRESNNYFIRIPNYSSQVSLNLFTPSPANNSSDHRDSDGIIFGNHIEASFSINKIGENNHDFDFGFYSNNPCVISIANVQLSPCNPSTNTFNLSFILEYANAPIGPIIVELSTGQKKILQSNLDGTNKIEFYYIASEGILNVSAEVYFQFDTNCKVFLPDIFDQPMPCCDGAINICSNRDNLIQLTSVPNMRSYQWYDSTTNQIVGFNELLIIDKNFMGLDDGYEAYYFIGVDTLGDTVRQECNYRVNLIDCCNLRVSNFIPLGCDNNGTVNDTNDDWFSVFISADNSDAGLSKQYEVLYNGAILATKPYNSSVVIGNSSQPPFSANGISTYLIMIRDVDSHGCFDTVRTVPTSCPKPIINIDKTIESINIQSDASYNVLYKIRVSNSGEEIGTYTLDDEPGFDDDIEIGNAFFTTTVPGKQGAALTGTGPWLLMSNQLIGPGQRHDIFINVNVKFNPNSNSSGDNIFFQCGQNGGVPQKGEGLFNRARLDSNQDGVFDKFDTICSNLPAFEISKNIHRLRQLNLKTHEVTYIIKVRNRGGATGNYTLFDRPSFDDDLIIKQANYSSSTGINAVLPTTIPVSGWRLQPNKPLEGGTTDSFFVIIQLEADLSEASRGNNFYTSCGFANSQIPRSGEGIFNAIMLDLNNDGQAELRDTVCDDIPIIEHSKRYLHSKQISNSEFEAVFEIKVKNLGAKTGYYDLFDIPKFDQDVKVQNFYYSLNNTVPQHLNIFNPLLGYQIANDKLIDGFSEDTFLLTFKVFLDLTDRGAGNNIYDPCKEEGDGILIPDVGLFNLSIIDLNNDGLADQVDTACGDLVFYDLALKKVCLQTTPIKFKSNVVFRTTVFNQGLATAYQVKIADFLPLNYLFNQAQNPTWRISTKGYLEYTLDSIAAQDSISFDLIVKVDKLFKSVDETINISEIFSMSDRMGLPVLDIDSTPDDNQTNDGIVMPFSAEDNDINGHKLQTAEDDEDDHDVAIIPIFDLALKKTLETTGSISIGQLINFNMHVYNQGSLTASRFSIIDYLPAGFNFIQAENTGWQLQNNELTYVYNNNLIPGDSVIIPLRVRVLGGKNYRDYINVAEIASANLVQFHVTNISAVDWDSTPDKILENDAGGLVETPSDDHIVDDGLDTNEDGITDEDDHDPEVILFWDLALKKYLANSNSYKLGDTVKFIIKVFNQGTMAASEVEITDYLPRGLIFIENYSENAGWMNQNGHLRYLFNQLILPGDSVEVALSLKIQFAQDRLVDYINFVEITRSSDVNKNDKTYDDIDSNSGSDNSQERNVRPGSKSDDNIDSDNKGGEEDDHDPAEVPIFDIALKLKKVISLKNLYGDTVCFNICLFNQGNQPFKNISISNYVPSGLQFVVQPDWIYSSNTSIATITINDTIKPGDSLLVPLKLRLISSMTQGDPWCNLAEIASICDLNGNKHFRDFDSVFDLIPNNDNGGKPNTLTDNHLDDDSNDSDRDGIQDEDDHDPECIDILDFALRKENRTPTAVNPNEKVHFVITVFNQGNVALKQLEIRDYLNTAYDFNQHENLTWSQVGNTLSYRFNKIMLPGSIDSVYLVLKLNQSSVTAGEGALCNWAEIGEMVDVNNLFRNDDADSNPGSDSKLERSVKPNDDNDNLISGNGVKFKQDEDDHDVAGAGGLAALGDMVWHDKNGNGVMENSEEGIPNVLVQLYELNSKKLLQSQQTDKNGKYLFERVQVGKYFVKFTYPVKYTVTKANATLDSLDSDLDNANGINTTGNIMLMANQRDLSWDLGLYQCAKVNGFVWLDEDFDGYYDMNERGVNGRDINIFSLPDKKLIAKARTSNFIAGLHTRNGAYEFCIPPGNFYIQTAPSKSYQITIPFIGNEPLFDSDFTNAFGLWTSNQYMSMSGSMFEGINLGLIRTFGLENGDIGNKVLFGEKNTEAQLKLDHEAGMSIIPNPAKNYIEIVFNRPQPAKATIVLRDQLGKIVLSKSWSSSEKTLGTRLSLEIEGVPPGQYHVLYNNEAEFSHAKLIILN